MRVLSAKLRLTSVAIVCILAAGNGTAKAQVGTSLSVRSEERFRGRPVSSGDPVVAIDLSYGAGDGFYAGVAHATVIRERQSPRPLSFEAYGGYTRTLSSGALIDVGITNRQYTRKFSGGYTANTVEAYVGVTAQDVTCRASLSPSYYGAGRVTAYLEVGAVRRLTQRIALTTHVGLLLPLSTPANRSFVRRSYDWRIGIVRRIGRGDVSMSYASAGPKPDNFGGRDRGRGALVIGAAYGF